MNTDLKMKHDKWPEFVTACMSQWEKGGERYALSENKEFTDLVCEVAGNSWIAGNIVKYIGEILNAKKHGSGKVPEVDFFKIAVYAFLWWLKERENMGLEDEGEKWGKPGEVILVKSRLSIKEHFKKMVAGTNYDW